MLRRFINWLIWVPEIKDPNEYPDIIPDISVQEIECRLRWDDEDSTANFEMEMEDV